MHIRHNGRFMDIIEASRIQCTAFRTKLHSPFFGKLLIPMYLPDSTREVVVSDLSVLTVKGDEIFPQTIIGAASATSSTVVAGDSNDSVSVTVIPKKSSHRLS